jgi:tetratricopeptide (TPR) repeat protein
MKKPIAAAAALLALSIVAVSQRIEKPTLTATPCTDLQKTVISTGVELHDAKKYDEAIAKYLEVIEDNPSCTMALYELSMSYYTKGDKSKALETALKGAKFKSADLPLFYLTLGNVLDDLAKYDEAVRLYNDAIKILADNKDMLPHLSSLHYNLGLSYRRQQKEKEAREEMKQAIRANTVYPSPHLQLAVIFLNGRYKVPALLAAARFVSLEFNSNRTPQAASIFTQIMGKTSAKKESDEKIVINLDFGAPTDEGDFGAAELILAMTDALDKSEDKTKIVTEEEKFAGRIESLISFLDAKDKKLKGTFSSVHYFPFMLEMKRLGYVKPFSYIVLLKTGNSNALAWLRENETKTREFLEWAKNYSPPQNQ